MPLNKEMIFGLAFEGNNMKMLVISQYAPEYFRSTLKNTLFVPSTPICISGINGLGDYANITITYPDGSSMNLSGRYASAESYFGLPVKIYVPEGTKMDVPSGAYVYYFPCKWINI